LHLRDGENSESNCEGQQRAKAAEDVVKSRASRFNRLFDICLVEREAQVGAFRLREYGCALRRVGPRVGENGRVNRILTVVINHLIGVKPPVLELNRGWDHIERFVLDLQACQRLGHCKEARGGSLVVLSISVSRVELVTNFGVDDKLVDHLVYLVLGSAIVTIDPLVVDEMLAGVDREVEAFALVPVAIDRVLQGHILSLHISAHEIFQLLFERSRAHLLL